jgi:hypothetical protein
MDGQSVFISHFRLDDVWTNIIFRYLRIAELGRVLRLCRASSQCAQRWYHVFIVSRLKMFCANMDNPTSVNIQKSVTNEWAGKWLSYYDRPMSSNFPQGFELARALLLNTTEYMHSPGAHAAAYFHTRVKSSHKVNYTPYGVQIYTTLTLHNSNLAQRYMNPNMDVRLLNNWHQMLIWVMCLLVDGPAETPGTRALIDKFVDPLLPALEGGVPAALCVTLSNQSSAQTDYPYDEYITTVEHMLRSELLTKCLQENQKSGLPFHLFPSESPYKTDLRCFRLHANDPIITKERYYYYYYKNVQRNFFEKRVAERDAPLPWFTVPSGWTVAHLYNSLQRHVLFELFRVMQLQKRPAQMKGSMTPGWVIQMSRALLLFISDNTQDNPPFKGSKYAKLESFRSHLFPDMSDNYDRWIVVSGASNGWTDVAFSCKEQRSGTYMAMMFSSGKNEGASPDQNAVPTLHYAGLSVDLSLSPSDCGSSQTDLPNLYTTCQDTEVLEQILAPALHQLAIENVETFHLYKPMCYHCARQCVITPGKHNAEACRH